MTIALHRLHPRFGALEQTIKHIATNENRIA